MEQPIRLRGGFFGSRQFSDGYSVSDTLLNSIFVPAAGYRNGTSLYGTGSFGSYWSFTPYSSDTYYAYDLLFNSSNHGVSHDNRYYGYTVRPVSE